MKSDPITSQGHLRIGIGESVFTLVAPPDLEALLDHAAKKTPQTVDAIPYYAILWPAAQGLARYVASRHAALRGCRVIELGCGLGLPSVVAARHGATVIATDFHPDVGTWLMRNAAMNGVTLDYCPLDWNECLAPRQTVTRRIPPAPFVMGSDLLYEKRHIPALIRVIELLCASGGEVWIADPGRDTLPLFTSAMEKNGWSCELVPVEEIYLCRFARATA